MRKIILGKTVYQWCQWIHLFSVIVFTAFACWVDFRVGFAFVVYELIRSVYVRIQDEERLIAELDREQGN
jgi:hypothetical protein